MVFCSLCGIILLVSLFWPNKYMVKATISLQVAVVERVNVKMLCCDYSCAVWHDAAGCRVRTSFILITGQWRQAGCHRSQRSMCTRFPGVRFRRRLSLSQTQVKPGASIHMGQGDTSPQYLDWGTLSRMPRPQYF